MFNPRLPEVDNSGNKELSFYIKMLKDQVVFPKFYLTYSLEQITTSTLSVSRG